MTSFLSRTFVATLALFCLAACAKKDAGIPSGAQFQKKAQEALILAKPGAVIELPEGKQDLTATLSLSVDNVTIRGKGMDKTILSFKNQTAGSSGLLITGNNFTLEDIAIEDAKGDGIKINGSTGVTLRHVRAEWTGGPKTSNGSYGIYPVQCKNVLIEDSVVKGAADAGFYVGQSKNIIVRRSRAEFNVAGIEIENSQDADVYQNVVTNNTGGILAFNLPDMPIKDGRNARIFENQIFSNNTPNFGAKGSIVSHVPTGTGLEILATNHIDIFKNTIKDNASGNLLVISYASTHNVIHDAGYDPYTDEVYIHDNNISGGGDKPDARVAADIAPKVGTPLPGILYDGVVDPKKGSARICAQNNGGAVLVNFDAGNGFKHILRNAKANDCALPPLNAVAGLGGN
ncbi:MAG: parallel beta-helix domain-containing protein [Bryobacteraceae bacterium]